MNSKQQGDIGVAKAIYIYTAHGYHVSVPNTDNTKYDLVVDNGTIHRVQVKTTTYKNKYGVYEVNLRTQGSNKSGNREFSRISADDTDLVFVLTGEGTAYEFPAYILDGKPGVKLGKDKDQYKITRINSW